MHSCKSAQPVFLLRIAGSYSSQNCNVYQDHSISEKHEEFLNPNIQMIWKMKDSGTAVAIQFIRADNPTLQVLEGESGTKSITVINSFKCKLPHRTELMSRM